MSAAHILIVTHDFSAGGTENIAFRLAHEWLAAGRRVTILAGAEDGPMRVRVPEGAAVRILSPPVPRSRFSRLRLGQAMLGEVRAIAPDAIFIPGNFHFILSASLRAAVPRAAIVAKVSNPLLPHIPAIVRPLGRWKLRRMTQGADCLVYMARELEELGRNILPDVRSAVIAEPNLPHDHATLPRTSPEDPPLVLMMARMEPQKNIALGIRAFAKLRERHQVRLLVLGEGSERPALEWLVAELNLDYCVEMPGFSSDTAQHLSRASMLLLSSRYEGYPAAVVEALAADVPVASTNCTPALASLITSAVHGCIATASTADALADAMAAVLAQPFTSGGVRAKGMDHHDSSQSAQRYLDLFDRLVAEKAGLN